MSPGVTLGTLWVVFAVRWGEVGHPGQHLARGEGGGVELADACLQRSMPAYGSFPFFCHLFPLKTIWKPSPLDVSMCHKNGKARFCCGVVVGPKGREMAGEKRRIPFNFNDLDRCKEWE